MEIYLLRHGIAESRELEIPDASRRLTPKGVRGLRRVLEVAHKAGASPALILTSPLRRAQETAAIASEILQCSRVRETKALLPEADPAALWKELSAIDDATSVLVAGHEPHLSSMLAFLLHAPIHVDFKKGALIRVHMSHMHGTPNGILEWMLTPRLCK